MEVFSWLKQRMAARAAMRLARARQQDRLALVLAHQAQEAGTVRQVALVQALAQSWLPARLRRVVEQQLQAALARLPIRTPGSPRSTGSSGKTARHSTSKRRRAR